MKDFVKNNKHIFYFLGFLFLSGMYFILQLLVKCHHPIWCPLDDMIPFIPHFILPYVFWYIYVPAPMIVMCFKDKEVFMRQVYGLFSGFAVCLIIFAVYPTSVTFRPDRGGPGIWGAICDMVYKNDNPWNVFPSLHCFEALIIHFTTFFNTKYGKMPLRRILSALTAALICVSTVFVKQHSIIDVLGGCALAVIIYIVIYLTERGKKNDSNTI